MAVNINIPTQVSQTITNGVTAFAPSEDAVFDALALKQDAITNPVTGTGANGQVSFWTGTGAQSGSAKFIWNEANEGLTINCDLASPSANRGLAISQANNGVESAFIQFIKSRGTNASPTDVLANDLVGFFGFNARVGGAYTADRASFGSNMHSATGIGVFICSGNTNGNYIPTIYALPSRNVVIGTTGSVITGGITDAGFRLDVNGTARVQGNFTLTAGANIVLQTTTGTRIGTATNQRLSLWNATPDVQPTTAITAAAFVANTSGIVDDTATFGGYTMGQVVAALKRIGVLA